VCLEAGRNDKPKNVALAIAMLFFDDLLDALDGVTRLLIFDSVKLGTLLDSQIFASRIENSTDSVEVYITRNEYRYV
jgi:hypothetical protein